MKKCGRCKKEKEDDQFSYVWTGHDKLQSYCKECNAAHHQKWYLENKHEYRREILKNQREGRKKIARIYVDALKESGKCTRCGLEGLKPWQMDFDHTEPSLKKAGISEMVNMGYSIEAIDKEVVKCRLVCANCHRDITHKQEIADKH